MQKLCTLTSAKRWMCWGALMMIRGFWIFLGCFYIINNAGCQWTRSKWKYIRTAILRKGRSFENVDQILFDRFNIKLTRRRLFSPAINITWDLRIELRQSGKWDTIPPPYLIFAAKKLNILITLIGILFPRKYFDKQAILSFITRPF